ncbi:MULTISPECIES: hypothetical protein [Bacillus amyloliquefaciens group]|nr:MULTISPECIES: hypothetical protein [Bacillus amyloliquefaciens group]AEB24417.1 hypothetical protein BAMTA208_11260 [Bacillus amyloliquefaciens TA208]AEK89433.1 hypothetical protein BAXH7_02303 [Bacillus amyloliquefaciens XH7]MED3448922.1 hypothetical protein [Bacillus velezensis]
MDEFRNWVLSIAGIVTICKQFYDIFQNEKKQRGEKEKKRFRRQS